ncbi:hypothetical protein QUA56_29060 [Microcoleus sp. N3A4]|uniref:hypothetical protein n=1 Tax=Microcoleus sp. N3A4 TaxID=3055379 RepID=UPI002FD08884
MISISDRPQQAIAHSRRSPTAGDRPKSSFFRSSGLNYSGREIFKLVVSPY